MLTLAMLIAWALGPLSGCAASPEDDLDDLPSLEEVRSNVTPPQRPDTDGDRDRDPGQRQRGPWVDTMLEQFELPLDVPLDDVWAHIDESVFNDAARSLWQANGLRVGVIRRGQLDELADALPEMMAVRRQRITSRGEPVPLRQGERLREAIPVYPTAPRERADAYEASRGRLRLLGRMEAAEYGRVRLQVIPQHHRRRHSVQPRNPREATLDGEIFHDLGLSIPLNENELLVIGLHHPWPSPDAEDGDGQDQDTSQDAQGEPEQTNDSDQRAQTDRLEYEKPDEAQDEPRLELRLPEDERPHRDGDAPADRRRLQAPSQLRETWRDTHGERPALPEHFGRSVMARPDAEPPVQVLMILSVHPRQTRRAERERE